MKKQKSSLHLRQSLAREAARLMYEEGITEYFTAKRVAAKRLLGKGGQQTLRHRPHDLPSNGEIREALLELADIIEGPERTKRLFAMRVVALETMEALAEFEPALIGSVSTGHVRRGSDIDIHVFTDNLDELERHLFRLGWVYELNQVTIQKSNELRDYTHIHLDRVFAIELSVHQWHERRMKQRSSTDGKYITRVKIKQLRQMLEEEHPEEWASYLETGEIPDLESYADDRELPTLGDWEENLSSHERW